MNTFSDPIKIIEQFDLDRYASIADFGSGAGAYTFAFAKKHAQNLHAHIYAIDIQQDLLQKIAKQAEAENYPQVHVVWGDVEDHEGTRLRPESVNLVLIANTLFQAEDHAAVLQEAYRVLKRDAHVVIIDWTDSFGNIGPKEEDVVTREMAELLVEANGFVFEKDLTVGAHHYGIVARKL